MADPQPAEESIRQGTPSDLATLNDIYNHTVRETPATFDITPIPIRRRKEWFRHFSDRGPHRNFGFREVGISDGVGWKFGPRWSVQWFELRLDDLRRLAAPGH